MFMGNNSPELPHFGSIIILLLNMIEDLIVGENFLILVIIDRAVELGPFSIAIELGILLFNGLDNVGSKPLTVLWGSRRKVQPTRSEGWNVGS